MKFSRAALANFGDPLFPFGAIGVGIALRPRAAEGQRGNSRRGFAPQFVKRVSADGAAGEERSLNSQNIEQSHHIRAELAHRDGAGAGLRLAMAAKIGQNHAISAAERLHHAQPEAMIAGGGMQQDHCRSLSNRGVGKLRVVRSEIHTDSVMVGNDGAAVSAVTNVCRVRF